MKTTIELPDHLLKEAKLAATQEGTTLRSLFTRALERELKQHPNPQQPWMKQFGKLSTLKNENKFVMAEIESEFNRVDEEAWM